VDEYISGEGVIILAGDAGKFTRITVELPYYSLPICHRQTPHAGLWMNLGVEDAVDIGFKLGALVK
jgi:hypothetical protein